MEPLTSEWTLAYESFVPEQERLREVLTSTGNGCFCTRGAAEWADADGTHYPGTYAHGLYNRETTMLGGRPVLNEDLVNLPNWLVLKLRIEDEEPIRLDSVELLSYRHELDVRNATTLRRLRFRDRAGRVTSLVSRRFVSMADRHLAALEWTVTPESWSGRVTLISALDGRVTNQGVERYRELEGRHLNPVGSASGGRDVIALVTQTRQSHIYVAEAARTRAYDERGEIEAERDLYLMEDYVQQAMSFRVVAGTPARIEKLVAFYTSQDGAINEPRATAVKAIGRYGRFEEGFQRQVRAWDDLWGECDIRVPRDPRVQFLLRFNISHILQVCSPHTPELDAGVPARGLNGEAYRGHVFWDELYVYPFLNFRLPNVTRGLLRYRYRRLDEARAAAAEAGYAGAMYPWQSGSDGKEETQVVHLNPESGRWDPDLSHNQRHVNAAIFYNIWHYYQATGDAEFLGDYGAEMMLEIARFWSSLAHLNPKRGRYEVHGVMGPDEFHERYPGAVEGGLRNNAYTNVMVAWICDVAPRVLDLLPDRRRARLSAKLGLEDAEVERWRDIARRMFVPFHDGVISQFEGYEQLEELDWDAYQRRHGNIQRLDRILKAEGAEPDRYKLTKQADALLLFFLFGRRELREVFHRLGYPYTEGTAGETFAYYDRRTSHGSTLSLVAHAGVLAGFDLEGSWERFMVALESDIGDIQGGTTAEGIHLGVMSGTLDLVQRCYVGERIQDGVLHFDPRPVDRLDGIAFPMRFRGALLEIRLEGGQLSVAAQAELSGRSVRVAVGETIREIKPGESCSFPLPSPARERD